MANRTSARKQTRSAPLQAAILQGTVRGFARLPLPAAQRLGAAVGLLLWRLPNRLRSVSYRNVERCFPHLEPAERQRLVRASLIATGMNVAEAGAMWRWPGQRLGELEEAAEGEELLGQGLEHGRGMLLLAPHVGNWEFLSHFLGSRHDLLSLYRPPRIAELDEFIRRSRERRGVEMVPASISGLRRLTRALTAGRLVVILPDQEPLKTHGVFAPFFGMPALTMTLVNSLLRRFRPAVVYGFAQRSPAGGFQARFLEAPEGLDDPEPTRAAERLNFGVERCVRCCPEQYMWSYRRFRTRPPEELRRGFAADG